MSGTVVPSAAAAAALEIPVALVVTLATIAIVDAHVAVNANAIVTLNWIPTVSANLGILTKPFSPAPRSLGEIQLPRQSFQCKI